MASIFEGRLNVVFLTILVLPMSAAGTILTIIIFIVINSSTIGIRNDRLTRRTSTDATAPATGLIISDQRLYDIEFATLLDKDATAAPVAFFTALIAARHSLVVRNINPAILTGTDKRQRTVAILATSDTQAAAFGVIGNVAGNLTAGHFKCDVLAAILAVKTSVDTAAGLMGVIGSNGATRHGQLSTVRGRNAAATEETVVVKVVTSDASVSSVVSYAGRAANGYGCTLGINTATVAAVVGVIAIVDILDICCVARDDTAGEIQRDTAVGKNAAAGSSLIRCDHAAGHVDRDFRARYAQAAAPAAKLLIEIRASNKTAIDIHMSFIAFPLGKDDMTVAGQIPRCRDHASVEVKRTAIRNRDDLLDRPAIGRSNDCAETADDMLSCSLGGAKSAFARHACCYIVSKSAVVVGIPCHGCSPARIIFIISRSFITWLYRILNGKRTARYRNECVCVVLRNAVIKLMTRKVDRSILTDSNWLT